VEGVLRFFISYSL